MGELMVHSRRGGQKRYDLRERVLAEAFGAAVPRDEELPDALTRQRYLIRRTVHALGVVVPSWLWDYFRLKPAEGTATGRAAVMALQELQREGLVAPAAIEGRHAPAVIAPPNT